MCSELFYILGKNGFKRKKTFLDTYTPALDASV